MSVASMANWGSNLVVALFFPNLIVLLTLTMIFLIAYDMRIRSMRP